VELYKIFDEVISYICLNTFYKKMKSLNRTYRIFALTMAFVMFTTTVNLAIDMHYCQGQFKSMSFFGKAETCHEKVAPKMANCPHHQKMMTDSEGCSIERKGCCDSKSIHIQSDNDQLNATSEIPANQELQQFFIAFVEVFFKNIVIKKSSPAYIHYQSPVLIKDTYVLFETFRI